MNQILLQSSRIRLRHTNRADLDFVLLAEQAPENRAFVGQWTRLQHQLAFSGRRNLHLIVESVVVDKPIGYLILSDLKDANQSINLKRIVITEKGQGYGHFTLQLVKQLAFEKLKAHRLWLDVKDFNQRARHLYEAEGFKVEGTLRECLKVGDNFESLVIMSILRSEYQEK